LESLCLGTFTSLAVWQHVNAISRDSYGNSQSGIPVIALGGDKPTRWERAGDTLTCHDDRTGAGIRHGNACTVEELKVCWY